jgi:hypothetical protein
VYGKRILINGRIKLLKHRIKMYLTLRHLERFNPENPAYAHILGYLNGIGAPGRYHLFPGSREWSFKRRVGQWFSVAKEPRQLFNIRFIQWLYRTNSVDLAGIKTEE